MEEPSLALRGPESLPKDLIQEMRCDIRELRMKRDEQSEDIRQLKARYSATPALDYQWKKDGNRRQYEVLQKLQVQARQIRSIFAPFHSAIGNKHLDELDSTLEDRIKLLRIADSSQYGWATVQEYENNPVAKDEEDDRKLKRAEKSAQERLAQKNADRKSRQSRFNNYNYGNRDEREETTTSYKAYRGFKSQHPYRNATVVGEKLPPKRNINNDVCFSCGSRGHWANHCPERKQLNEK